MTIFAYGVTGTGKTHTMRGGLRLAERGVIPRLLSHVFRRGKKVAKDSDGETAVDVVLSYYEIYNDKVHDLLEPLEKRTPSGLPLREKDGRTVVVGLSERSCKDLKDFERLYIEANNNRVTAATKLNAHSSRSHAILRVKVIQITGDTVRESTASAIDLAGSEDTESDKERLVESAAINKSLFVLSQCVDAISRGEKRIPYRESKMTRILSLGQNNGITVMILNLAPMRSYHLDTLSSLNVSSRAKRIEVREIENEIIYKQVPPRSTSSLLGTKVTRQPLRPLANAHNVHSGAVSPRPADKPDKPDKPVKSFSVYVDRSKAPAPRPAPVTSALQPRRSNSIKRKSESSDVCQTKMIQPLQPAPVLPAIQQSAVPAEQIETIERKVSEAMQRRLDALERRIDDGRHAEDRSEGLRLLLVGRQQKEIGDDAAALKSYEMALPFFPGQAKLLGKIEKLKAKLAGKNAIANEGSSVPLDDRQERGIQVAKKKRAAIDDDDDGEAGGDDEGLCEKGWAKAGPKSKARPAQTQLLEADEDVTPRKNQLLAIVNSRDIVRIKSLTGFGAKKARDLVDFLDLRNDERCGRIETLEQLQGIPGIGGRMVERAYEGLTSVA